MLYFEVSPTKLVRSDAHSFTYSSDTDLSNGSIVRVPVGKQVLVGVVLKKVTKPSYDVRPVEEMVYNTPLPEELVKTALWMSQFYNTHLATVWQTLLPTGITKKRRKNTVSLSNQERDRTKKLFTDDQKKALDAIEKMDTGTTLLHGVTGSGKTLVYIEAAKRSLESGKSVIVLVPEIALTSQIVAEFSQHFESIILTHSRQTEAERHLSWQEALESDSPRVVIGPRSALFMPLKSIGLIAIDECHEPSFKQEQAPRYSALRVASILSRYHHAKVVLGSATPSVSDFFLARHTKSPIVSMPQPARKNTKPPETHLVDMTLRTNFTQRYFLSNPLIAALEQTFKDKRQALIFHNRRGTSSTTLCTNCGWHANCPRCFVPFTLHADKHRLSCHICASEDRVPTSCPDCGNADIIHKGIGTKKIEEELRKLFPEQQIARFDADTASDETVEKNYSKLYKGEIDLIIGTQVIAKGLDLPHLRTVGVVQADAGLSLPDFGSSERTFQLLAQVVGRVGRSEHQTKVVVQSYQPDHPAIKDGLSQNYSDFYERTIDERKKANFPPFCHLLKATCIYKTESSAVKNARKVATGLRKQAPKHVEILGPTPAFYERVRDTYRWQLIIKSPKRQDLLKLAKIIPKAHWQVELDPVSLL